MTFLIGSELPQWILRILILAIILISFSLGINAILYREIEVQKARIPIVFDHILNCIKDDKEITIDTTSINWRVEIYDLVENKSEQIFGDEKRFEADYPLCNITYKNKEIECLKREFYLLKNDRPLNLKIILIYKK